MFRGEAADELKSNKSLITTSNFNPLDSLPRADISNEANKIIKKLND